MKIPHNRIFNKESITVDFFYQAIKDKFDIKLLTKNVSLDRLITQQNLHRPGLALAGFVDLFSYDRVQIVGNTEVGYLEGLSEIERATTLGKILTFNIPCVIFTHNNKPTNDFLKIAEKHNIPIFSSSFETTKLTYLIGDFLDDHFSPRLSVHGSFTDVYGVGMLFMGNSGIGKSEVALDLIERGHRLVADDVVILTKKGEGIIMGSGTDLVKHFMEIRGIGIIDVRSMFGIRAIRYQKRLEVIIELEIWDESREYTRTGLESKKIKMIDVDVEYIKVPIIPGKNLTVISEVIALNYLSKQYGYNAAEVLNDKLTEKIRNKKGGSNRSVNYFEHDFE